MDINKLKTFLAISNYGSFKEAAEHLFLSPRAVSKQMNQIESELNIRLFNRKKNSTSLNPAGKDFVITAQEIVNTYNNALTKIQTRRTAKGFILKSGISSPTQSTIWQTALTNFLEKNPLTQIELEQGSGPKLISLTHNLQLDFCITPYYRTKSDTFPFSDIERIDLYEGEFYIGISKMNSHSNQKTISFDDVQDLNVLYYTPYGSAFLKQIFLEKFAGLLHKNQIQPISTLEQRNLMVATNRGIGLFPNVLEDEQELQNPLMNFLPIEDKCNKYYATSLWYSKRNSNPALRTLVKEIKSAKDANTNHDQR